MNPPIIFIHYGDSYYLKYTLESAVLFNPEKRIIILGDESSAHYEALGVEHFDFEEYATGQRIELFDEVYRYIAGKHHGRHEWTRFVFRRWFLIYNFIVAHDIHRFWTFDSDNLILTRLSDHEAKFEGYDCTEQCSGICMNGFITNAEVVKGYVDKINELFQRTSFLEEQEAGIKLLPWYAYTEMRAYVAYREEAAIKSTRLSAVIEGEAFIDSICTLDEHRWYFDDDAYETYDQQLWGHDVKKIYLQADGHIFLMHVPSQQLVKLNSINMSWVPEWLFATLLEHAKRRLRAGNPHRSLWGHLYRIGKQLWQGNRLGEEGKAELSVLELADGVSENDKGNADQRARTALVRRLLGLKPVKR